jgi:hypothetical protein
MRTKYRFWTFIAEVLSWKYNRDIKRETLIDGEKEAHQSIWFCDSKEFWEKKIKSLYRENFYLEKDTPIEKFINSIVETKVSKDTEVFEQLKNRYKFYKFFDLGGRRGSSICLPSETKDINHRKLMYLSHAKQMYSENSQIVKKAKREYEQSIYPIACTMLYGSVDQYVIRNIDIFMWFIENVVKVHGDKFAITNHRAGWHKDDHIIIERI